MVSHARPALPRRRDARDLGGKKPCKFSVSLPPLAARAEPAATDCAMARELRTQVRDGALGISELSFAAAPEHFHLHVTRDRELIYESDLRPKYAPYETTRADDKHFCGDRARVVPRCIVGSSECEPFPVTCSECSSRNSCFAHFGHLVCQADADCPSDLRCLPTTLSQSFSPALLTCESP